MSETEKDNVEISDEIKSANLKKARHRKKQKYNAIRKQMEFYFGDSNLTKNRFIKQLINQDPYVPLEIFLTFNRMKLLTDCVKDIATALQNSTMLQLSDDKLKVKRVTPIVAKDDLDDYTIYVESLPPNADHDWITNSMSVFGPVNYVSLPRYRKTRKIKEFAFVEFEQKSSVEKALRAFEEFGGLITAEKNPEELMSVITYIKENDENTDGKNEIPLKVTIKTDGEDVATVKETGDDEVDPPAKKIKLDVGSKDNESIENENTSDDPKTITHQKQKDETVENDEEETEGDAVMENIDGKKKRKRIRKKKIELPIQTKVSTTNDSITDLRITSKQTWKRLRNQYLTLQREKIKKIKQMFRAANPIEQVKKSTTKKLQIKPTRNINFYGAMPNDDKKPESDAVIEDEVIAEPPTKKQKELEILNKKPLFTYHPGLIVNIKLSEPCVNIKDFKDEMRQYQQVKYIDVKEGACEAFVRVDCPESTATFIKQIAGPEYNCTVMSGTDEENYWQKIKKDREDKLTKKVIITKPKQQKAVHKILSQAIHVRFDDD